MRDWSNEIRRGRRMGLDAGEVGDILRDDWEGDED